ncbi:C6 transcription factor [Colletotrichum tofieldiae]|uniref:C6 transcription factor n=1 Tax=Colletotrichum tofieldiae TaxID=708197 RepID=A0A166N0R2_9PEZI|nr:C6 transcription factor [Colletotrichum tofieldiae]
MNTSRSSLSLLAAAPDPNDFDYEALFQGDELLLGDENTYSSETLSESSPNRASRLGPGNSGGESSSQNATAQKQRLERRGHTKSRRGCFNCKRRRIKCQETHPSCGHCAKSGLKCEYPNTPAIVHQPHHQVPLFSLQDMRFFQHFMLQCYPHHPIGNENIWTHEVPCLSQSHEFLMHAILGMAACDLMNTDPSLLAFAMAHRVKAIKAIKKSLAELPRQKGTTSEHANALVATCFALTFQSVTFEDGMPEYMTFIRGILIIGTQMWIKGIKPIFVNIIGEDSHAVLEPKMADLPLIQKGWADGAVEAIGGLRGLCRDVVEVEYFDLIMEMATKLHTSSWEAYQTLTKHYGWWIQLPHEKFQRIIDMGNQTMVLLASHWIALKQIMAFITNAEHECREKAPPQENAIDLGIIRWLGYLNKQVDHEHLIYNQWPLWVESQLNQDLGFFGKRY